MCYAEGVAQWLRIPFGHRDNYNVISVLAITSLLYPFLILGFRKEVPFQFNITINDDQQQHFFLSFGFED
jgi:hypothetical protein